MSPPRPADLPLAVYVHVPFCLKKCPYCDFNSHTREGTLPEAAYLEAVRAELARRASWTGGRRAASVFFGGGTPSLFGADFFAAVLEDLDREVGLAADCEVTLEANPGASEAGRFAAYREAGVNRLSIGVQSLEDDSLARLGRVHSAAEARGAVAAAREAGFDNLNLDLMFGLPGQTPEGAVADLEGLLALDPEHVALYQLTIEPNTVFAARPPALPDEDVVADTEAALRERLAEAGFGHYEVSNHARPGRACRHNRNYWEFGDYLGLGAGAHGKLTTADGIRRTRNYGGPDAYLRAAGEGDPAAEHRDLEAAELPGEFALNALRLTEGVPTRLFEMRTGLPVDRLAGPRAEAERLGLLDPDPERLAPTARGRAFLNDLVQLFLD
ncbi:coproporphyrinogen III oxidase [Thiohalorhabdus denitrificans]|uniref:Heme chaperone HemW n=1 Tax=Thiohalorhabdus denitrificans TaxID=381306 RepID=A0A0P9EKL1_9GAMM|nr:radical SAM family heme chaperone HemW [Thiohalorhabdus denitrificans]KPV39103.1 coproporphyrinogen III oxidase [Thiohalorhabdus denitrificans]SCX77594.1 oxygen-independent coproporphyrinogen-3 oxidase [Thiohalorhabdus denitrificans]